MMVVAALAYLVGAACGIVMEGPRDAWNVVKQEGERLMPLKGLMLAWVTVIVVLLMLIIMGLWLLDHGMLA